MTNVAPAFGTELSVIGLMGYCLAVTKVEMIVEIIVSVLPRPITSASMPPVQYEGMLSRELFCLSARRIKHFLITSHYTEERVRTVYS